MGFKSQGWGASGALLGWPALLGVEFGNLCSLRLEPPHQEGTTQSPAADFAGTFPPPPGSPGPQTPAGRDLLRESLLPQSHPAATREFES